MTTDMKIMQITSDFQGDSGFAPQAAVQCAQLSALADGQLQGDAFADALALLDADAQARATWHTFHVVADVLRSTELAACHKDAAFLARLKTTLQQEPCLKPSKPSKPSIDASSESGQMASIAVSHLEPRKAAALVDCANEPIFRWKWVAGLSSVAAALAISWNLVGGVAGSSGAAPEVQLTQVATLAPVSMQAAAPAQAGNDVANNAADNAPNNLMLRNPQLDALIAAHSQLGGSSALQMPSGFLRSATFNGAAR